MGVVERNGLVSPRQHWARLALIFAGLLWVLPFVLGIARRPLLFFYPEWSAGALGILACSYLLVARRVKWAVPNGALFLLALALWCVVQPLIARLPYTEPSFGYAIYLLWAAFLLTLGKALTDELGAARVLDTLAWFALVGGLLGACTGLVQKYGGPGWLEALSATPNAGGEIYGNIRHRSYFADHIVLGLLGGLHLVTRGRLRPRWMLLAALPMVSAMGLASSRATLLCLVLVTGLSVWHFRKGTPHSRPTLALAVLVSLAYAATPWILPSLEPYARQLQATGLANVFDRLAEEQDVGGLGVRLILWRHAVDGIAASPWLGAGPDGFAWQYYSGLTTANIVPYTIHSHNLIFQIALCFGVLAALAMVIWIGHWILANGQRLLEPGRLFLTGSLLVIGQRALLDLPLWVAPFLGITALLAGIGESGGIAIRTAHGGARQHASRYAWGLCLILGAALMLQTLHSYHHVASLWSEKQSAAMLTQRYRIARENFFLTPVVDSIMVDAMKLSSPSAARMLSVNTRVMRWRPYPRVVFRQTAFLALNGRDDSACRLLRHAAAIYPHQLDWFRTQLKGVDQAGQPMHRLATLTDQLIRAPSAGLVCPA